MAPGERHRRIEADDREPAGDVEDRLDDRLARLRLEVVELGGVVPRHTGPVVAVVDVALAAGPAVDPLEHDRGVAAAVVVVLDEDADALVVGEVRAAVGVPGVGILVE